MKEIYVDLHVLEPLGYPIPKKKVTDLLLISGEIVKATSEEADWYAILQEKEEGWFLDIDWATRQDLDFPTVPEFKDMKEEDSQKHFQWFLLNKDDCLGSLSQSLKYSVGEIDLAEISSLVPSWEYLVKTYDQVKEFFGKRSIYHEKSGFLGIELKGMRTHADWLEQMVNDMNPPINAGLMNYMEMTAFQLAELLILHARATWDICKSEGVDQNKPMLVLKDGSYLNPFQFVYERLLSEDMRSNPETLLNEFKRLNS